MGLLLLTERTQERLSRAPRAPFHRAVDHWAARCTMMYPLIGQYVAQDWAVDMSGRGRHMTTHYGGGGSIFPSREILRGNYVAAPDALTPDIECLFLPQDLTAKGLGVPAVAEDFGDFNYYTVIVWCAAQKNIAFSHYGQMFGSFNAGTVDYNFRLDFRYGDGGPTGSRDHPAFVGQGGNGAVGADNSMVPYYERATMFVGRYDKDVTLEYNLVLNDFEFEVSGNDPLVGSRSFIANSITSFGNRTDSVGSFRSPGPVWNARYMTRAISDDEILALYEQPWLGYEEYGRTLISIPAPAGNVPDRTTGVELDGSTEYFNRGALVGAGDTKTLTLSTWLKVQSAGLAQVWFSRANGSFHGMINIFTHPSNGFSVVVNEVGTTNKVFNVDATSAVFDTLTDGNWHHVMFSGNAAATTFTLWVDGVKITAFSNSGAFDRTIDWTVPDHWIGADYNLASKYNGCIGEFYLTNEYLDFDVAANRLKFRAANGGPADLGANGSTPTGTQPLVYLSGGASQFADNFGSGGAFTVNGTPIDCPIDLGVTVTPAGVNAAGAPGTLAALGAAVHQLSGTAATGAPGSLTALGAAVQALTGVAGSGAIGVLSITGEALVVPFGTAATGAAGTVIVETAGGATVELSGVATAAAPGQLNVTGAAAVALAGVLAQGQVGTLFIAGEAVAQLEGVAGAGQVGLVSIDEGAGGIAVTISGVAITGLAGDVTAQGAAQLTLGGVSVTGTAGGLTLIIPTETTPENRVLIIEADDRTLIIAADGRTLTIH